MISTILAMANTALTTLAVPFAMDVYKTANGADLPDVFMAYSLTSSQPEQHADNVEVERSYDIQVSVYSRSGLVSLPDVNGAMVAAGFQKAGIFTLPFNNDSGHFGIAFDYTILSNP